ncbi:hypothetical protein OIDMADRAFT_129122 [Oidiodendron maius Zn]|uniref:FAD/NAD(P)-binding domain-containing protein n=1 Tax=Oidiodendron maius (strain Zn) TaxID=913774 RepID=A0A0C3D8E4_OIDMZ|nr:hypothetical protein OIDMADRAFT_129122 [Oidiodendron maius Zn]
MDAKSDYAVKEQPLGTLRRVRIVTIGAGMSGINIIRTLRLNTSNFEHVVYEKNEEIGGTWFENRYPGCACDIPSHNYQFSHTPNPEWSCVFSESDEIQSYLQHVCDKHELREYIKLSHSVQHAQWDEESGKWILKVKDEVAGTTFEDRCDFLLDASGILNDWKWPDIKGLHSFKGDLIHSARWPKDFSYAEKTVAVIGNGSSGVQIVPALQPTVKKLVHILRSPTWISPPHTQVMAASPAAPFLSTIQFDAQGRFTESQMEEFKTDPQKYGKFVKVVEAIVNSRFPSLLNGSPEAMITRQIITQYMTHALNQDETLMKALIPDFPVGCRRMTPGVGYLDALTKPNVQTVITGIEEICPEGIKLVTGELIVVDAIVCATGFNLSFVPRFPIIGTSGNLQDIWKDSVPAAYMSCMVPNLPNYFTFLGPNAPIGHGSVVTITEHIAKYITKIIMKCQLEDITSVRPSPEAVKDFSEHIANFMPRTAWSASCSSWFKNGKKDGPVTALHPGSRIHWFHMLELPRWEDFEWKSAAKNRFAYLGNGLSTKEAPGQNSTWYLDAPDALW